MNNNILADAYIGNYIFGTVGYYIHQHQINVGKANEGSSLNDSDISILLNFKNNRENSLNNALSFYKESIHSRLTIEGMELLNDTVDPGLEEKIMSIMADSMQKSLTETADYQQLLKKFQSIEKQDLNNLVTSIMGKEKSKGLDSLNKILGKVKEAIKFIFADNESLRDVLINLIGETQSGKFTTSINRLKNLKELFEKNIKTNKTYAFSEEDIERGKDILSKISSLGKLIEELSKKAESKVGNRKSLKESVSKSLHTGVYNSLFSTGFGELGAAVGLKKGIQAIDKNLNKDFAIKLVGTETVDVKILDKNGKPKQLSSDKRQGKADLNFSNFQINLQEKEKELLVTLNTGGVSVKTYKNLNMQSKEGTISLGSSGITLEQALSIIFGENHQKHYLSYNILSYNDVDFPQSIDVLYNLLASHFIINYIGSRGMGKDMADFLLVNGQVVSLMDILLQAQSENEKLGSRNKGDNSSFFQVSLPDRFEAIKARGINDEYNRVSKINQTLKAIKLGAKLHWNKLSKNLK